MVVCDASITFDGCLHNLCTVPVTGTENRKVSTVTDTRFKSCGDNRIFNKILSFEKKECWESYQSGCWEYENTVNDVLDSRMGTLLPSMLDQAAPDGAAHMYIDDAWTLGEACVARTALPEGKRATWSHKKCQDRSLAQAEVQALVIAFQVAQSRDRISILFYSDSLETVNFVNSCHTPYWDC